MFKKFFANLILGTTLFLVSSATPVLADAVPPVIAITAPTHSSNATITNTTIHVTDDEAITAANVTVDPSTTAGTTNFNCTQTDGLTVDCTIDIISSGNLTIQASDDAVLANSATQTETGYSIDSVAPAVVITSPVTGNFVNAAKIITFTDSESTSPQCSIDNVTFVNCTSGATTLGDITGFNALSDGNFTLYLKDTDSTSNTGTTSQANITKDTVAQVLSTVHIVSNNANTTQSRVGNVITLTFTSAETIQTPTVSIMGHPATVTNLGSNNYSAAYTLVQGDTDGTVTFNISFADTAGNSGSASTTTDSSSVNFDSTIPNTPTVAINNPINLANRTNVGLTISGEVGTTYNYSISDGVNTPITGTGTLTSATFNITGLDLSGLNDGTVSVSVTLTDAAGNTSSAGTYSSTKDTSLPTIISQTLTSSNANTSFAKVGDLISLLFTSSESIQTPTVTIAGHVVSAINTSLNNWLATWTLTAGDTEGVISYTINFLDIAGNSGVAINANSSVSFDMTNPVTTDDVDGAWHNGSVSVHLNCSDSLSGCQKIVYTTDGSDPTSSGTAVIVLGSSTTFTLSAEGIYTIKYYSTDNAGNQEATKTSGQVKIDLTNPIISGVTLVNNTTGNSNYVKNGDTITLTATITDNNQALLTASMITADLSSYGGGMAVNPISYDPVTGLATWASLIVSGTGNGNISITIDSLDIAGNSAAPQSVASLADNINPSTIDNTDSSWHNSGQTITLTCSDSGSGCFRVYYTTDGSTPTLASSFGNSVVFPSDGIFTIKYFSVDNAGNISAVLTAANLVKVDQTAPTGSWINPQDGSALQFTISILTTSDDNLSGVASAIAYYKLNDGVDTFHVLPANWDTYPLELGNYTLRLQVIDNAGNVTNIDEVVDIIAVITNLKAEAISADSVLVTWDTNHPTRSRVRWNGILSGESESMVIHHVFTINGLSSFTDFSIKALARIPTGPYAISDDSAGAKTFSLPGPGTSNPTPTPVVSLPEITKQAVKAIFEVPTAYAAEKEAASVSGEATESGQPQPEIVQLTHYSDIPVINWIRNFSSLVDKAFFVMVAFVGGFLHSIFK